MTRKTLAAAIFEAGQTAAAGMGWIVSPGWARERADAGLRVALDAARGQAHRETVDGNEAHLRDGLGHFRSLYKMERDSRNRLIMDLRRLMREDLDAWIAWEGDGKEPTDYMRGKNKMNALVTKILDRAVGS